MGNLVTRLKKENLTDEFNVVITPAMESAYTITLQTVGISSTLLSLFIMFLIIFRTPSQVSNRLQLDMIGLQICFLIFDVHVCCLFIPKSTLPYFAGYCMGVLCGKISFHGQFAFAIVTTMETLAMFFVCLLQRFFTLTEYINNHFVLNTIKIASIIFTAICPIYLFFIDLSKDNMIRELEITPKMMWLLEKQGWILYFPSPENSCFNLLTRLASIAIFLVVLIFSGGSITLIILISKYFSKMASASSKSQILRTTAIRNLILQFTVFSAFLSIPSFVIVIPLLFALDSGTIVFLISEAILCSHGLANSIVAIAFNSNFRRTIRGAFTQSFPFSSPPGKRRSIIGTNQHRPSFSRN